MSKTLHRQHLLERRKEVAELPGKVCDSLVHELDDLVFASQMWQRILLLTFLEILHCWEAGDLEALPYSLVHRGIHCCQRTWALRGNKSRSATTL